jgi:hypothetical protein
MISTVVGRIGTLSEVLAECVSDVGMRKNIVWWSAIFSLRRPRPLLDLAYWRVLRVRTTEFITWPSFELCSRRLVAR